MEEKWIKWYPVDGLSRKYYIDFILDSWDGFKIVLFDSQDKKNKLTIFFEDSVESYRFVDESYVDKSLTAIERTYGKKMYVDWSFFKVENSSYLKSLSEESGSLSDYMDFTHYVLILEDAMIDIVNRFEPIVTLSSS